MSDTADKRVETFLEKMNVEARESARAEERAHHEAAEHAANVTKIKEKWAVDTKLICEILDDFREKMTALGHDLI